MSEVIAQRQGFQPVVIKDGGDRQAGTSLWRPAVLMRFAEAIEHGKLPLVPNIMVGGGDRNGSGGGLVEMMLAMLVAEKARSVERQTLPRQE
jgi:hypothetical protein